MPTCSTAATTASVDVKSGCTPNVDGILHAAEWSDATCVNSITSTSTIDQTINIKYSGDALYIAESGPPGSLGTWLLFDPNDASAIDNDEFEVAVFNDPFGTDGDGGICSFSGGTCSISGQPSDVITRCPGNEPSPIRFEWKVPFADLGITAGTAHSLHFAFYNAGGEDQSDNSGANFPPGQWPASLGVPVSGIQPPPAPSKWGELSSTTKWK